ncbi:hypothetical protein [Geodermatophilus sp. SYSU D01119]
MNLWDWLVVTFAGDRIAVLGPRASGKTTLYNFLTGRTGDSPPEQTVAPEHREAFRNGTLGLSVRTGRDVPGGEHAHDSWREVFTAANKVFYLFDAHQLRVDTEYADRVRRDGRSFRDWGTEGRRVMMIGTHADTDPACRKRGLVTYSDLILDHDIVAAFRTRADVKAATVGSLAGSPDDVAAVLRQVLN